MLTRLFNNLSIQALLSVMLFSYAVVGAAIYLEPSQLNELILLGYTYSLSSVWYKCISIAIIPILAYVLNSLLLKFNLLKNHYYFIPLFSIQLVVFAFSDHRLDLLLLTPLLVWFLHKLIRLLRTTELLEQSFDIGVWVGLLSIVVPEFIFLIPAVWLALLVFGLMNIRTLLIPLLGLFTTFTVLFCVFYFSGIQTFWDLLGDHFRAVNYFFSLSWEGLLKYIPLGLLFGIAALKYLPVASHAKIQKRQFMNFNFMLAVAVLFLGFIFEDQQAMYVILVFPFSLYGANMLQYSKKWWAKDLVYLTVLISLCIAIFYT